MCQSYSLCQIAENNGKNGKPIWLIVKGVVYDMTNFVKEHPGGEETILEYAGKDATTAFNDVGHSADAIREMKLYKIGVVETCSADSKTSTQKNTTLTKPLDCEVDRRQAQKKKRIKLFFCF